VHAPHLSLFLCVCVCARVMHTHTHTHSHVFCAWGGARTQEMRARGPPNPKNKTDNSLGSCCPHTYTHTYTHTHTLCVCVCACVCVCVRWLPFEQIMASDVPHRHKRPRTNNRRAPTRIYIDIYIYICIKTGVRESCCEAAVRDGRSKYVHSRARTFPSRDI